MFLQVGTDAYLPQHRVLIKNRFPGLPRTTELEFPGVGWEQDYLQLHETRHMMRRGAWDFWTRGGPFDSFPLRDSGNLFSSFVLILRHLPPPWDLASNSFPYISLHLLLSPSVSLAYFAHQYNYCGVWW